MIVRSTRLTSESKRSNTAGDDNDVSHSSDDEVPDDTYLSEPDWQEHPDDYWTTGRVLIIDLFSQCGTNRKESVSYEFNNLVELECFHKDNAVKDKAALRIIHAQNFKSARDFYAKMFPISSMSE